MNQEHTAPESENAIVKETLNQVVFLRKDIKHLEQTNSSFQEQIQSCQDKIKRLLEEIQDNKQQIEKINQEINAKLQKLQNISVYTEYTQEQNIIILNLEQRITDPEAVEAFLDMPIKDLPLSGKTRSALIGYPSHVKTMREFLDADHTTLGQFEIYRDVEKNTIEEIRTLLTVYGLENEWR